MRERQEHQMSVRIVHEANVAFETAYSQQISLMERGDVRLLIVNRRVVQTKPVSTGRWPGTAFVYAIRDRLTRGFRAVCRRRPIPQA